MAEQKINGTELFLRKVQGQNELIIVCEQNSELTITSEGVTVQCKASEWTEFLNGGTKSGTISFTGLYVKDPAVNTLSYEALFAELGKVGEYIWGGINPGDLIVETEARLNTLTIVANDNEGVTFNFELGISGEPTLSTVST
jgi:hypothetical protein